MYFRSVEDFTPENVTAALRGLYPDAEVTDVRIVGEHQGSATHIVLELGYAAGMRSKLPKRMFTKTLLDKQRESLPSGFSETFADDLSMGFHFTEVRAFELLDEAIEVEIPKCYARSRGAKAGDFYIFLEDLNDRSATCPKVVPAVPVERVSALMETLARLHAAFWESPRLRGDCAACGSNDTGGFAEFVRGPGWSGVEHEFQIPYKGVILDEIGIDRPRLNAAFWRRQAALNQGPQTFLHGDPHPGNIYFLPDGSVGLLDWQLARCGSWSHDVSYAIQSALDPSERRAHERDLLAKYFSHLKELGVKTVPSDDQIWLAHRQAPAWGLPMWGATPDVMYSREEVETVVRRFATAWTDFDTNQALGF